MKFVDVIGQDAIKKQLKEEVQTGRLSHARLLVGKEGVGKFSLALAQAQYVNCKHRTAEDACGTCPSCLKYQKVAHPDLHFVFPIVRIAGKSSTVCDDFLANWRNFVLENPYLSLARWYEYIGVDNKQGVIYAEESNEIVRKLNLKNYEAEYKVVILWLPEKMHLSCANKLLKILEEPPQKTLFYLLSEREEEVLPTIYSRTQLLKVPPIAEHDLLNGFSDKYSVEQLQNVVALAEGSATTLQRLMDEHENTALFLEGFKELMRLTYSRRIPDLYNWAENMAKIGRERQKQFLDYCSRLVRENFVFNSQASVLYKMTPDEQAFSEKFAPFISSENIEDLYGFFVDAYEDVSRNGNPRIIFMDLCVQITRVIRKKS